MIRLKDETSVRPMHVLCCIM